MSVRTRSRTQRRWPERATVALAIAGVAGLLAIALLTGAQDASSQSPPRGNDAFSTFYPGPDLGLPDEFITVATLDIPEAGSYVVDAKLEIWNSSRVDGVGIARCSVAPRRGAGEPPPGIGEGDLSTIDLERDHRGMLMLQFAQRFTAPGEVVLRCRDAGTSQMRMNHMWITATQVDSLTKTRFVP